MNKLQKRICVPVLALSLFAGSAHAALVDSGNSMIDQGAGLQWLDLTETLGKTWNAVVASTLFTIDGYRHATSDEVNSLFLTAGFLTTNNVNNPANDPAAKTLLSFLGCTQFCGTVNATGRGFAQYSLNSAFSVRPNYHTSGLGAGAAVISLFSSNFNLVDNSAGHFLVRVAKGVNVVPIPAALPLFVSALVALGFVARRRRHI